MPAVVPVSPKVTRENVEWTLARMAERVGNEYVYGGQFDAADINVGCDCSALVAFICNGVLYGPRATFRRVDGATGAWITTESWRPVEVGDVGPFGSITVASPADIPADAAVRIALHHGPGGGAASHTWCEVDGHRFESNGSRGCVTDPEALPIDSSYGNDWAYIPGPIDAAPEPEPEPEPEPVAPPAPAPADPPPCTCHHAEPEPGAETYGAHAAPVPPPVPPPVEPAPVPEHHAILEGIVTALGELARIINTPRQ